MTDQAVHFEITGNDPSGLRDYFTELFGWQFDLNGRVSDQVSVPDDYGFSADSHGPAGTGIPGGIGGGTGYQPQFLCHIDVDDVEQARSRAEALGGRRVLGPATAPSGLIIGHFTDLEGNLIGVATPPKHQEQDATI